MRLVSCCRFDKDGWNGNKKNSTDIILQKGHGMKKLLACLLAPLLCVCLAHLAHARLAVDPSGSLVLKSGGKAIPVDDSVTFGPVRNSDMQFAAFGEETMAGVPAGIYLFKNRAPVKRLDVPDPELCFALSLSPNGAIVAADSGTSVVREWTFYNLASGKKVGRELTYVSGASDLVWMDGERVLVTYPDGAPRPCQTDQCAPLSVGIFNISTGSMHTVFKGDDRCDFTLFDVSPALITAERLCLESREAWADYMGGKAPDMVSKPF